MDVGSVCNFIAEQENKATLQKIRDVKLLQTFLGTRNEPRKVHDIPALELNEYICEFIISVRAKDRKDYEQVLQVYWQVFVLSLFNVIIV